MSSYAFWNNKGGVGKSFLCFVAACEYAHYHPDSDVYVIDLCPQANVSETLLGGYPDGPKALNHLLGKTPRMTVAGYLEARLNSPFQMIPDVSPYLCEPNKFNANIPENLRLVCGDNLLEIISEAIRQTSQLSIPIDAWKKVQSWILDPTA
jgi:cellulose biosynthesis protein BcsQ